MLSLFSLTTPRGVARGVLAAWIGCLWATAAWAQGDGFGKAVPPLSYYVAQSELYSGDYTSAVKSFTAESRGAIKTVAGSWIDSICYRAMLGETYYHLGKYPQAIENYNAALQLYSAFSDWMLRVQFPAAIPIDTARARRTVPWGQSTRQFKLGRIPDTMPIQQGQVNNNNIVQQGGVVQKAVLFPVNVHEIVRCTALALRRRAELMGPICKHDPLTDEVLTKLARRPVPRNHWSEGWIDLQLGLAQLGAGQLAQAQQSLQRAIVIGGEFDHPLTCVALLELGRMAMRAGDFKAATTLLAEASYSAVYYEDLGVLDEALRLGLQAHLRSNQPGLYPPLAQASRWARTSRMRHLQVWLSVLTADNYTALGQPVPATAALAEARGLMARRDLNLGVVAARLNYVTALAAQQRGRPQEVAAPLAAALTFQRGGSRWLYQISLADNLYTTGAVSPRTAMEIYQEVLRDPGAADWSSDPLEALSVLAIAHDISYENWFEVALQRKEVNTALVVADRARRHRYLTSLPMWGRLLSLRKILDTPAHELPAAAALQRQDLLVRYPRYDQLAQQAAALRLQLRAAPLVAANEAAAREQMDALAALGKLSAEQEGLLQEMALRREPADLLFPPLRETKDVQATLPSGHFSLVFFQTRRGLHAFLLNGDRYAHWRVGASQVHKALGTLLRDLGNYDPNRQLSLEELNAAAWRAPARALLAALLADSKVDLAKGIEELVIVPDGAMWYVPFELLPLGPADDAPPLLSRVRVRYVPTMGLAPPDPLPRGREANLAVVAGRLFPNDKDGVGQAAFEQVRQALPEATRLPAPLPAPSSIYRAAIQRLLVLEDTPVDPDAPYGWTPLNLDKGRASATFAEWFPLPWGLPDQIVLPGFHTPAASALKRRGTAAPGSEMFLNSCALLAGGSRTVLLSRWRTGGATSVKLATEFLQELPYGSASAAWQRSVELAKESLLNWETEPRLKRFESDAPPTAAHPFFWSGYALIDTGAVPLKDEAPPAADEKPKLDFEKLQEQQEAK